MTRMLWGTTALVALSALVAPSAVAQEGPDLTGIYTCEGVRADGSQYRGFVHIIRSTDSYLLAWRVQQGPEGVLPEVPDAAGIGIVSGDTLAVSYFSETAAGVIAYRIEQDGEQLQGARTLVGGDGRVYRETLIRLPGHRPPAAQEEAPDGVDEETAPFVPTGAMPL